ncbi:terminase large subunit domain-containing protein [Peptacetobacter sp. AB800]|uniref:terminase large subunit domain-containing protein n=1 Tax=Peptacetobacter sp. AB800 TaxID=3388428 RepID=UPI0039FBFBE3
MKTLSRKRKKLKKTSKENLHDGTAIWTEFYRKNPHRLVMDYLQLEIFPFQCILLYMMNICTLFAFVACRGLGKSYLTALFCVVRCILYPNTKVVLASGNKKQAGMIITEKIEDMRMRSIILNSEIEKIQTNNQDIKCIFRNGSIIQATVAGDGGRGLRGNVLIIDEYRLVKKDDIDLVLKQFLTAPRRPKFLSKTEYKNYPKEPNKELYLSSAWYKSHWSYDKFLEILNNMMDEKNSFCCDIPYTCSLDHGLLLKEKIDEDRNSIGEVKFEMEYCGLWFGENEKSYFKSDEINQCRVLKNPFYPLTELEILNGVDAKIKNKGYKKQNGEIRLISADIAIESGEINDNSIYTLLRMLPDSEGYKSEVVWMENHNGLSPEKQAMRLKELYEEFEADKIIMDTNGNGIAVFKEMQKSQYNDSLDKHYNSFTNYNKNSDIDEEMSKGSLPVIYALKPNAKINNDIAIYLKNAFRTKTIRLLKDDNEKRQDLEINDKKFNNMTASEQIDILEPFIEITSMVNEIINLEYEAVGGNIKISEKSNNRKDRYSSIAYANYLAKIIEHEEIAKKSRSNNQIFFFN